MADTAHFAVSAFFTLHTPWQIVPASHVSAALQLGFETGLEQRPEQEPAQVPPSGFVLQSPEHVPWQPAFVPRQVPRQIAGPPVHVPPEKVPVHFAEHDPAARPPPH